MHFGLTGASKGILPTLDTKTQVYLLREANGELLDLRKLTPLEAERSMGFPDGYTDLGATPPTPRFKAIGNSMSVHVMQWIGERIKAVGES